MIEIPNCYKRKCKHLRGVRQPDGTGLSERCVCAAYPNGIPDDIAFGNDLHTEVRTDQDNDIVFEHRNPQPWKHCV
jgi:hypothetical protein